MKFRTILIDDEYLAITRLERLLQPYSKTITIIEHASDGFEAVEKINMLKPDLIFLDIQMPELNGFEVLDKILHLPIIIFSTAYDKYALKAFETNAIDYLLKPIDPKRLVTAIEKLERFTLDDTIALHKRLENMLSGLKKKTVKRIYARIGNRTILLNPDEIYFFRAADKYVEVFTYDKSYLLNQSLSQLELELSEEDFVRIHRASIINFSHFSEIERNIDGHYQVIMNDKKGTRLSVSRSCRRKLGLTS